jgi:predicted hydrocarbon binding protein
MWFIAMAQQLVRGHQGDLSMNAEIVLQIASAPGIQLRVVKRLKMLGLVCTKRTLKKTPFIDTRYLELELEGPEIPNQQIIDQLRGVHGILSVDRLEQLGNAKVEVAADKRAPEQQIITPEEGDQEIRDRMLVFSLLSRYPNVGGRLYEILSTIPEEDRLSRARELGHSFGLHLFKDQKLSSPVQDIPDALTQLIVPAVSPMADVHLQNNVLAVTSSKINVRRKRPQKHACQFMLGVLKGLLSNALPGKHHIEKLCCAADGADSCKYKFQHLIKDMDDGEPRLDQGHA